MWGTGVIKGFGITIKNMFRPTITVQYPEQRLEIPERARWAVRQKLDADGAPKCTACLICVKECPDDVLRLFSTPKDGGGKHIDAYVYEVGACMMCGLCVAACPYDAIEMSHEYELATRDHGDLVRVLLRDVDAAPVRRTPREDAAPSAGARTDADARTGAALAIEVPATDTAAPAAPVAEAPPSGTEAADA